MNSLGFSPVAARVRLRKMFGAAAPRPATITVLRLRGASFMNFDVVPKAVVDAACEMARKLLIVDSTGAPPGEGVLSTTTGAGATLSSTLYNKGDTRPIVSHVAQAMLRKFGALV